MIRLHAEQLEAQLQRLLYPCYFLFGNDLFLEESQNCIRVHAKEYQFDEHFSFQLDSSTDWNAIFSLCQERNLFTTRQTLLLSLPDSVISKTIAKNLLYLTSLLHEDLLLILKSSKLTPALEKEPWFKALCSKAVLVECSIPKKDQLPNWVARRAKNMKINLDYATCKLLCYCYEGNLFALVQALNRLPLIYPGGNLTLLKVADSVNHSTYLTFPLLVNAMLMGKIKRAAHILHQLRLQTAEPTILLRSIQHEIIRLLMLKREMVNTPLRILFKRYKVEESHQAFLTQALGRLTTSHLQDTVILMVKIELALKQDHSRFIWSDLHALALVLCGKKLPKVMLGG